MFKKSILLLLLASIGIVFCGCTSVEYHGSTYGPTKKVKVYYDKTRINRKYHKMGKATASTWYSYDNTSLRPALIEKAKASGADAILILSIDQSVGPTARRAANDQVDMGRMSSHNPGVRSTENVVLPNEQGKQTTRAVDTSQIVAEFLKYDD